MVAITKTMNSKLLRPARRQGLIDKKEKKTVISQKSLDAEEKREADCTTLMDKRKGLLTFLLACMTTSRQSRLKSTTTTKAILRRSILSLSSYE
jgi:hypothetical protein